MLTTRRLVLAPLLAGATVVSAGSPLAAQRPAPSIGTAVDSIVAAEAISRGTPGVGIVIVAGGSVVVQRGYGRADVTTGRAATAATTFNIASLTKPFTAAVVLQLFTEGAIRLDDPVRRHLPSLPDRYRTITVRQLLTHTSGIARDLRLDNVDDPDAVTYRARLDSAAASATPGARFEYSNTGFSVLGWMVEAVEGRPLDEVLRRRVFDPLGMRHARYRAPLADDQLRAPPHLVEDGAPRPGTYVTGGFGSGGMSMSAADAAAFAVALQGGRFLPASLADSSWHPARLADGTAVSLRMFAAAASYGLGWFITEYDGHRMLTHGGGIEGYSANLYHFPAEELTIIVLANTKGRDDGTAPVDPLARRIADFCLARNACRPDPAAARLRTEITAANRAFSTAYLAGDTAAIRAMYTTAAVALPSNGRAVVGAGPVSRLFQARASSRRLYHALYTERLVRYDSAIVELGTWVDHWQRPSGETGVGHGRYILTWVRTAGGWRIASDSWVPAE